MEVLQSRVRTSDQAFRDNKRHHEGLVRQLRERLEVVPAGGSAEAKKVQEGRGKLMPRARIERLLDPETPFLELSSLAAYGRHDGQVPSAGMITGIGVVHGRECMIVANDSTVKGGSYYPETVKKHVRAQEIAFENRLPCIYL